MYNVIKLTLVDGQWVASAAGPASETQWLPTKKVAQGVARRLQKTAPEGVKYVVS